MPPVSGERPSVAERFGPALVAGAAAVVLLSGCSPDIASAPSPSASTDARSIAGPCLPPPATFSSEVKRLHAQTCADFLDHGKIALITFADVTPTEAEAVAADVENNLHTGSHGLIKTTVTVVHASPAAEKALAQATPGGCVDLNNLPSQVADEAMPEQLSGYGILLGLSDRKACANGLLRGIADPSGNYAEIFEGAVQGQPPYENTAQEAARVGTHELLHELGEGHAGEIYSPLGDTTGLSAQFNLSGKWDLQAYLPRCTYNEYGDPSDTMGISIKAELDAIHLEVLRRAQVVLDGRQASFAQTPGADWATVSTEAAQSGHFMLMDLPAPITLQDPNATEYSDGRTGTHAFSQLALLPVVSDSTATGVKVYAVDPQGGNSASLGIVYFDSLDQQSASWEIASDIGAVDLQLTRQGLRFRKVG